MLTSNQLVMAEFEAADLTNLLSNIDWKFHGLF
jgi:hypothetical protein